jgi:transposase-like protein
MDKDYIKDLAIKIMDYVWYEYMGITDEVQDYDFHMQDTIQDIIKKHMDIGECGICPHCGSDNIDLIGSYTQINKYYERYKCTECNKEFTEVNEITYMGVEK